MIPDPAATLPPDSPAAQAMADGRSRRTAGDLASTARTGTMVQLCGDAPRRRPGR